MTNNEKLELEFLRYFYSEVDNALGPASDDVYYMIKEEYKNEGNTIPEGYDGF
jgi:hypothetical protein